MPSKHTAREALLGNGRSALETELLNACKAAEAYCVFMERHGITETNVGLESRPPLKTLRAAIRKAEGE
jgi:hypothetical protein